MNKTPADVLADIGRALFGEQHWRLPLADALGVHERTIRRFMTGAAEITTDYRLFAKAEELLRDRQDTIASLLRILEQWRNESR
jgi:hypothetical protein